MIDGDDWWCITKGRKMEVVVVVLVFVTAAVGSIG